MMARKNLWACSFILILLTFGQSASAAQEKPAPQPADNGARTVSYRESIRRMPLLARPHRPGHFYGNAVRRLHHRRHKR